jgi:hypothetical protein
MAMEQSSGSIGSLAAALARAQVELINPEKSMVATIRPEGRGAAEQIFRYAPLPDGLNIIRKTLGQHEIATLQSTSVDETAGLIRLKTGLAGLPTRRLGEPETHGGGAHLCAALRSIRARRHSW